MDPDLSLPDGRLQKALSNTWVLGAILCTLALFLFLRVNQWSERNEFARLDDLATRQLDLYAVALESELTRHADLPSLVAIDPDVVTLLRQIDKPQSVQQQKASQRLAGFAARAGTREIFVTDRNDVILAASEWYAADAPVGKKLPGISCAAANSGRARGFLFNPRTRAPEYYFVHAIGASIAEPTAPTGCVVVKVGLSPMESTWVDFSFRPDSEKILVLDEQDVTILSSVPRWRYKTTNAFLPAKRSLPATDSATAPAAQSYPASVTPLDVAEHRHVGRGAVLISLPGADAQSREHYVAHSRTLVSTGWQIVLLSNPEEVWDNIRAIQLATASALAFISLLALYLQHRRRALRQLLLARNALQRAHDDLEIAVTNRTRELREANAGLLREMHERQQAEEALMHANKMAMLGQMSAKISHEISQPLTALRALATNSRTFLRQEKWARVDENMQAIADLAARMTSITRQLKQFSGKTRKQPVRQHVIDLRRCIHNAQALLQDRLQQEAVELDLPDSSHFVLGDSTQLEQVFVNLLANALDAMQQSPTKRIEVTVDTPPDAARLLVRVRDSGTGIPDEMREHLFEPFYTSKPTGVGLGLGLVICASIILEHGGQLRAENRATGAEFTFDLERTNQENPKGEPLV